MSKNGKPDETTLSTKIGSDLKRDFRILAAERDTTMSDLLGDLVEIAVRAHRRDRNDIVEGDLVWDKEPKVGQDTKKLAVVTENPTGSSYRIAYMDRIAKVQRLRERENVWEFMPSGFPREDLCVDRDDDPQDDFIATYPISESEVSRIDK